MNRGTGALAYVQGQPQVQKWPSSRSLPAVRVKHRASGVRPSRPGPNLVPRRCVLKAGLPGLARPASPGCKAKASGPEGLRGQWSPGLTAKGKRVREPLREPMPRLCPSHLLKCCMDYKNARNQSTNTPNNQSEQPTAKQPSHQANYEAKQQRHSGRGGDWNSFLLFLSIGPGSMLCKICKTRCQMLG